MINNAGETSYRLIDISFENLMQMYSLERKSLIIEVTQGNEIGRIFMVNGEIHHAETKDSKGEEAFYQIQSWNKEEIKAKPLMNKVTRSISKSIQGLLLESAKLNDENNRQLDSTKNEINSIGISKMEIKTKENRMENLKKDEVKEAILDIASSINSIYGALAVTEDGSIISESGINDLDTIAGIILYINSYGKQIGESLQSGNFVMGLVNLKDSKLLTMKIKTASIGVIIDPKSSILSTIEQLKQLLRKKDLI